ncbi:hypothetical protein Mgra_00006451 [Meloidogyne graminicola]|uniref:TAR DNA-binding protein 43 N-terminal domain-containing protein n=1 Tax=Meloidogyne graminicola TaxID=189291 RepID=A0A8S9ZLJ1_9BILA|nr:hypothetical protein Mgra_00006451 [Meloidogyne graminicola]
MLLSKFCLGLVFFWNTLLLTSQEVPSQKSYVLVKNEKETRKILIRTTEEGLLPLKSVSLSFPDAVGLKCNTSTGYFLQLSINDNNMLEPPPNGWINYEYITIPSTKISSTTELSLSLRLFCNVQGIFYLLWVLAHTRVDHLEKRLNESVLAIEKRLDKMEDKMLAAITDSRGYWINVCLN